MINFPDVNCQGSFIIIAISIVIGVLLDANKKAFLYVFNTMSDWEYGYLIAELNSGRYFKKI